MKPKILLIAALLSIATGFYGCATTPIQGSIKAEAILITSVDTGMLLWHDYVFAHLSDGKVTQKQIDSVRAAYSTYYNAQQVAKAAIMKVLTNVSTNQVDVNMANNAVEDAKQSLLNILNQYIK